MFLDILGKYDLTGGSYIFRFNKYTYNIYLWFNDKSYFRIGKPIIWILFCFLVWNVRFCVLFAHTLL